MDRSFVSSIRTDPRSKMIVESTRHLAQGLGLRMVAEGVEDIETMNELADMGIDLQQGYHIARPMPSAQVEGWIRRWSTQPSYPGLPRRGRASGELTVRPGAGMSGRSTGVAQSEA